jgi:hypothetical protein
VKYSTVLKLPWSCEIVDGRIKDIRGCTIRHMLWGDGSRLRPRENAGPSQPISPDEVHRVPGPDLLQELSEKSGSHQETSDAEESGGGLRLSERVPAPATHEERNREAWSCRKLRLSLMLGDSTSTNGR